MRESSLFALPSLADVLLFVEFKQVGAGMKVQFLGAARTVTGSCYIIETNDVRFAVDFGMYQGNKAIEERNTKTELYNAKNLDFILLTHAHIDHSGLLPRAAKDGFEGPIYCSEPTAALLDVMLQDSAYIQEMEAQWASRKLARQGKPPVPALYTLEDAQRAVSFVKPVAFDQIIRFKESSVTFSFREAGHILGAAFIEIGVQENGKLQTLVFSGDLGRPGALLTCGPATPRYPKVDYLFIESTYGNRNHKSSELSIEELAEAIQYSYRQGEKVIIPAFAIERTQEVLYLLKGLHTQGKIPADMPIYVDSPLAIKATEIFRRHFSFFCKDITDLVLKGDDPFRLPNLFFTPSVKESQDINALEGSAIIISASGMCNAGRVRHHLRHNLWRKGASIVFTGYQAIGSPGRRLVDGARSLSLFGEDVNVAAKIYTIGGFSAHAGQDELVEWAKRFTHPEMQVFFMHGEDDAISTLAGILEKEAKIKPFIPDYLSSCELNGGVAMPTPEEIADYAAIDWQNVFYKMNVALKSLEQQVDVLPFIPLDKQYEVLDDVTDLSVKMRTLLKHADEAIQQSAGQKEGKAENNERA